MLQSMGSQRAGHTDQMNNRNISYIMGDDFSITKELRHLDKGRQQPLDFELGCCLVKLESILFSFLFTSTKLYRGGRKKKHLCEIRVLDVDPPF